MQREKQKKHYSPAELSSPLVAATGTIVVVREKLALIIESAGSGETFGLSPRVVDAVFGGRVAGSPLQQARLGTAELAQVLQHRDHCPWVKTSPVHQRHAVGVGFVLFFTRVTLLLREIVNAGDEASCISYGSCSRFVQWQGHPVPISRARRPCHDDFAQILNMSPPTLNRLRAIPKSAWRS